MRNRYVDSYSMKVLSIIQFVLKYCPYFQLLLISTNKKKLKISKVYYLKITYFQNKFSKNCQPCFLSSKTILKNNIQIGH